MEEWVDRIAGDIRRMLIAETPLGGGTGSLPPEVLAEREQAQLEGLGRALVGGLLKAALQRGVHVATGSRGLRLLTDDGAVTGVEIEDADGVHAVHAGAVVLATGGFEYDRALVRDFLRGPLTEPFGAPTDTGDGLRMAMRVGAQLGNMREAWWSPIVLSPGTRRDGGHNGLLASRERALPGAIMVNRYGRRFANEAANYNAIGGAFHRLDESKLDYLNVPAYMVFDRSTVDRFGVFGGGPGAELPDWVTRADTLEGLAAALGLPADALRATVDRFNEHARAGVDPDFGRGRERLRPLPRRPDGRPRLAVRDAGPGGDRPLLRRRGRDLRAGHQGRPAHRHARAACWTSTATSSAGCTRRATRWPARPGWSTAAPGRRSPSPACGASTPGGPRSATGRPSRRPPRDRLPEPRGDRAPRARATASRPETENPSGGQPNSDRHPAGIDPGARSRRTPRRCVDRVARGLRGGSRARVGDRARGAVRRGRLLA